MPRTFGSTRFSFLQVSYAAAKSSYHEWLMPSDRIMWGSNQITAEGIYGVTESTRRRLAEVVSEKVLSGDLREQDVRRMENEIFPDNALALFPDLKQRLWKRESDPAHPRANARLN